jgi:hypothetical protein
MPKCDRHSTRSCNDIPQRTSSPFKQGFQEGTKNETPYLEIKMDYMGNTQFLLEGAEIARLVPGSIWIGS